LQEQLLQFIWQHSLYNPTQLYTVDGEIVTIVHPGSLNTNAGPDFLDARVRIDDTLLAGNIELHILTSDWQKHGHSNDAAYNNVILHVVYENDIAEPEAGIPLLILKDHIAISVLNQYESLSAVATNIPCATQLPTVRDITKEAWLSRLLVERWEEKLVSWKELLDESVEDWRNLLYWRMAANFGFKINAEPFLQLARSLPLNILAKHKDNKVQIEALLFGQSGMLDKEFKDEYPNQLNIEYQYLRTKYKLQPLPAHLWKFLRLRPANFPTIRIAQFADLITRSLHLFSQLIECNDIKQISPLLQAEASEYWRTHYTFDELAEDAVSKKLGKSSIENIIINTVAPIQFLYAQRMGYSGMQERALQLLDTLKPEKNHITDEWAGYKWPSKNASESQAHIQLYNNYCLPKKCLQCAIGLNILKAR
jgi:hypothetical protein